MAKDAAGEEEADHTQKRSRGRLPKNPSAGEGDEGEEPNKTTAKDARLSAAGAAILQQRLCTAETRMSLRDMDTQAAFFTLPA